MVRFLELLDARWGGAAGFFQASGTPGDAVARWRELFVHS
jgi:hypothetical protein